MSRITKIKLVDGSTYDVGPDISNKLNTLTFDTAPTKDSTNPITSGGTYTALEDKIPLSQKGATNGVATLDSNGKVPTKEMPYEGLTDGSLEMQEGNIAGSKGFYYKYIDFDKKLIYLTHNQVIPNTDTNVESFADVEMYEVGNIISITNNSHYDVRSTIVSIKDNVIGVDVLPFNSIDTLATTDLDVEDYTICVYNKPNVGVVNIGTNAFAGGEDSKASGRDSIAYGINALAAGNYSAVFGKNSIGAYGTIVSGKNNTASADYSAAFNQGNIASGNNAIAVNRNNVASGPRAFASGEGTEASGSGSHSEGYQTKATNNNAHTEGNGTLASGPNSHAEGLNSKATAESSHSEGSGTTASAKYAHAEGNGTQATANDAHAEGYQTKATNQHSHAEGRMSEATNNAAHAEGNTTHALGNASHAEGQETYAYGVNSHAEGWATVAGDKSDIANKGKHSHAEGAQTVAKGRASHAEGGGTIAAGEYQHAGGRYNVENSNLAEIIGNGTKDKRSNARTLDWEGNEELAGGLTTGSDIKEGGTKLSEKYILRSAIGATIPTLENGIVPVSQLPPYAANAEKLNSQPASYYATAASVTSLTTTVNNLLDSKDAMQFKGVITQLSNLPTSKFSVGWTYKSNAELLTLEAGDASEDVHKGDLIICVKDAPTSGTVSPNLTYWAVFHTSDDTGTVVHNADLTTDKVIIGDGNNGIKASTYTIASSVPANAKFTDTNNATTETGHYTPTGTNGSVTKTDSTNALAFGGRVITGLTLDSKKHITGYTTQALPNNPNTNTTYSFAEGTTNGAFSVTPSGGTAQSVKVHGLGTAAYTNTNAYDASGAASTALASAKAYADALLVWEEVN